MPSTTITKVAGLALGALACTLVLVTPRIARPAHVLSASLTLTAAPTGELGVSPIGTVFSARNLRPGSPPARGTIEITNQTGVDLAVGLRARPASGDLDDAVSVRITGAPGTLFDGPLAALRSGTRTIRVRPGTITRLRFTASLPPGNPSGFEGRSDDVALELTSAAAGGAA